MFPDRYYAPRYFARRHFARNHGVTVVVLPRRLPQQRASRRRSRLTASLQ